MRKAKAYLELNLARDLKDNKKGFFKYNKRKTRENVGLVLNGAGTQVTEDTEKAEILNYFFALVLTVKDSLRESLTQETRKKFWRKGDLPLVEEDRLEII